MGVATIDIEERVLASTGQIQQRTTVFEHHNSVMNAGVLLALPALISQGLLHAQQIYKPLSKGYYGFVHILLLLAYMALSRIKNPEQLKTCPPGELGKIMGIDRVPEVKCLREKISQIVTQNKAEEFERYLSEEWISREECVYFYIDGHVRVYNGYKANLSKKYVSRQKLCLAGTTEYWVNDEKGLPFMVFTGELNERLKDAIENHIVPALIEDTQSFIDEEQLKNNTLLPRFSLVFDREAYEPVFFARLWDKFRIAVITYRKNVKDKWDEKCFYKIDTEVIGKNVSMLICEKQLVLSGHSFREIRKLGEGGHQTSLITTNQIISTKIATGKMFSRWSQENFFRYLKQDFDFDKMIEYGVETLNENISVVNPVYSQLSQKLKKLREKKARVDAKLFIVIEDNIDANIDSVADLLASQASLKDKQIELNNMIEETLKLRLQIPARIKLKDMPELKRYNKLKHESKLFMNTIKMIAYRAETALVNIIKPFYKNSEKDGRQVIKEILKSDADIIPDYFKNTLTIKIHSLSTNRTNFALEKLCEKINETETLYPETNLKIIFKTVLNHFA